MDKVELSDSFATMFSNKEARMTDQITPSQFHEAEGVEDWRLTGEGATAFFRTRSFAESARFVQAISELQGVEDHSPGVDVRHDGVTVHMITYTSDYFGPSRRDVELARQISAAARKLGLAADPSAVQSLLIIPGATNIAKVIPFWRAVLGYEPRRDSPDEDLVDPHDRGPAFWFEQMNERQRPFRSPHGRLRDPQPVRARVAAWCATSLRPHGGRWPTRRGTRLTSPPQRVATERPQ